MNILIDSYSLARYTFCNALDTGIGLYMEVRYLVTYKQVTLSGLTFVLLSFCSLRKVAVKPVGSGSKRIIATNPSIALQRCQPYDRLA